MNTKTTKIIIISSLIIGFGLAYFIYVSNDHIECQTVTEYKTEENGTKIKTERHICKEKYSF